MPNIQKTNQALVKNTCSEWLEICRTPIEAAKALSEIKTIDDSLAIKTPQFSLIRKEKGEKYVLAYVKMWIVDLQTSLNIKNKMHDDMVDLASVTILDEFWMCTIGDIKNIFTWAKVGKYGEFYESISIPKILSWFFEYFEVKFERAEANSNSEHSYTKSEVAGWKGERVKDVLTDMEKAILRRVKK